MTCDVWRETDAFALVIVFCRELLSAFCMNPNTHRTKGFAGLTVKRPQFTSSAPLGPSAAASLTDSDAGTITITIVDKPAVFKLFIQVPCPMMSDLKPYDPTIIVVAAYETRSRRYQAIVRGLKSILWFSSMPIHTFDRRL